MPGGVWGSGYSDTLTPGTTRRKGSDKSFFLLPRLEAKQQNIKESVHQGTRKLWMQEVHQESNSM